MRLSNTFYKLFFFFFFLAEVTFGGHRRGRAAFYLHRRLYLYLFRRKLDDLALKMVVSLG